MSQKAQSSKDPKNPMPGDLHIDCTSVAPLLIDLPPGAMAGMRKERPGLTELLTELGSQQKSAGQRAGIPDSEVQRIMELTEQLTLLRKYREPVRKLNELLEETEASIDHERHQHISNIAVSIDQRAKLRGNGDLLALYRATRQYRSAIAMKAVRTRIKTSEPAPDAPQ